jgi:hypothetical protein
MALLSNLPFDIKFLIYRYVDIKSFLICYYYEKKKGNENNLNRYWFQFCKKYCKCKKYNKNKNYYHHYKKNLEYYKKLNIKFFEKKSYPLKNRNYVKFYNNISHYLNSCISLQTYPPNNNEHDLWDYIIYNYHDGYIKKKPLIFNVSGERNVKKLLNTIDCKKYVDFVDQETGNNILHYTNNILIVDYALKYSNDSLKLCTQKNKFGSTPIFYCKNIKIFKKIIDKIGDNSIEAFLNIKDDKGNIFLHKCFNLEIIEYTLTSFPYLKDIRNDDNFKPYDSISYCYKNNFLQPKIVDNIKNILAFYEKKMIV